MALTAQGLSQAEIAARIGIKPGSVAVYCHYLRRGRGYRGYPKFARIRIERDVLAPLASHAAKRGLTVDILARRILQAVVDGNLVDAVLDDGEGK
jgi:transcriptional regulator with XRE-family HTH domain